MTTFHLDRDGDDYRIVMLGDQFVMHQQTVDGTWKEQRSRRWPTPVGWTLTSPTPLHGT